MFWRESDYEVRFIHSFYTRLTLTIVWRADAESDGEDDASTVAPSVDVSGINVTRRNSSEADRKAQLLADPRAEVVDPDFVVCRKCQKRIKASRGNTKYSLSGWKKHQEHCSDLRLVRQSVLPFYDVINCLPIVTSLDIALQLQNAGYRS